MNRKICFAVCSVSTIIGIVIGWKVGEQIGIAALPPNAWAGDGIGVIDHIITGSGWGALSGFSFGVVACLTWYFFERWRQSHKIAPQASDSEAGVWPPPPTQRP